MFAIFPPSLRAADNWTVEGANGTLYVHGVLTESACRLELTSAHQEIALANTGTGRLNKIGARGEPAIFKLQLTDCLRGTAGSHDVRTGGTTWADSQPSVTVSFKGMHDADNPQLVKVNGVSGLGLRLQDCNGLDVRFGGPGKPLLLMPGQNVLCYTVAPERTSAELVAGYYRATVDFHLSYE
ncbi:fimbrial protein [Enterobacter bugandensis]|uniref:fimbrial protein n=1 Tax=Enterobacter bugandensis TaxID=881260 RepID=UPI001EF841F6|nr:fimbrial protein [Enterobacter bugandensis]